MGRIVKADSVNRAALSHLETEEARAAAALVIKANHAAARIGRTARQQVIELARRISERIVLREVEADSAALDPIYRSAVESSRGMERAVIRVHPEDRARFPVEQLASESGFNCVDDEAVGRAGCVIVAGGEAVDATLGTALRCFEEAMKDGDHDNT